MSVIEIIATVFAVIFAAAYFAVGCIIAKKLLSPTKKTVEDIVIKQTKRGKIVEGDMDIPNTRYEIKSRYGYTLEGRLYKANYNPNQKLLIWLHGYEACYINGIIQFKLYSKLGYDVFLPTHRHSGNSGGKSHTFGYREKEDVKAWIEFIKKELPYKNYALAGESMGASTAILVASEVNIFDFVILDSPYTSMQTVINNKIGSDYPSVLKLFLPAFYLMATLFFNVNPLKVMPIKAIEKINIPILLTHSKADKTVPYSCYTEYNKKRPDIESFDFEDSPHCQAIIKYPEIYREKVTAFVKAHEKI